MFGLLLARPLDPALRASGAIRVAIALVAAAIVFPLALLPLGKVADGLRMDRVFMEAVQEFEKRESALGVKLDAMQKRIGRGEVSDAEAISTFESEAMPVYRDANARLSSLPLPARSKNEELKTLLVRYASMRHEGFMAIADGLRTQDNAKAESGSAKLRESAKMARDFKQQRTTKP